MRYDYSMIANKPYIIANWKMNLELREIQRFFSRFNPDDVSLGKTNVIICPSLVFISHCRELIGLKKISLGAQNLFWEEKGAYTGEVSGRQIADAGCHYVIIGHSERRAVFGETDEMVNEKIKIALKSGLRPIVCLGESYQEKEDGQTTKVIEKKLAICLDGLRSHEMKKVIIAYEPVWAISTNPENTGGLADTPESAQVIHKFIKKQINAMFEGYVSDAVDVVYGGSVNSDNISGFAAMDDIDGVLVGGASKEADSFMKLINAFIK
jgi:triosephosphate isomerase (TIM)